MQYPYGARIVYESKTTIVQNYSVLYASVAQMVEHTTDNRAVDGSSPSVRTI